MKTKILFILFSMTILLGFSQDAYYWHKSKKVVLKKIAEKRFIIFNGEIEEADLRNFLNIPTFEKVINKGNTVLGNSVIPYKNRISAIDTWMVLEDSLFLTTDLKRQDEIIYESSCYCTEENVELAFTNLFYVKLFDKSDIELLEIMTNKHNVMIMGNNQSIPLYYTLACSKNSGGNAMQMANLFYESGCFELVEYDFFGFEGLLACVNDSLFQYQWDLNNTGFRGSPVGLDINFCQAREITTGIPSVKVAVFDTGIDKEHPDLNNIDSASCDVESPLLSPSELYRAHGTCCAGTIGASTNNNKGIAGIAPGCKLMAISSSFSWNFMQKAAGGITFAWHNGAAVISNSWGGPNYDLPESEPFEKAIDSALIYGRGGLGTVIVFASHNKDCTQIYYPASYSDSILVVGGNTPYGERINPECYYYGATCDWGSNYGQKLDIVAPGCWMFSTDIHGAAGYRDGSEPYSVGPDYFENWHGTSASCPIVAAVAALVLSRNTHLTQKQVVDVIESTAQKVSSEDIYDYQITAGRPNGTWHEEMGYGMVDAYAAVMACPTTYFENKSINTDTEVVGCDVDIQNVSVGNNAKLDIEARGNITITGPFEVNLGSELVLH
ncbi:MAG: S8 family serine peptidase [Bacteroidales bacterium]